MALIKKISYKVSGDYYKPKTTPRPKAQTLPPKYNEPSLRQSVTVAPTPVISNKYTRGEAAIPGMAGWKVPAAVATPPVYTPPPAPTVAPVPIVNPYTTGQAPIPGMAGYRVTQKPASTAAGGNIKKTSQLLTFFDSLFKPAAPQPYSSAAAGSSLYMNGVLPVPGMAGWKVPQREQGVGFQPSKQAQVETFIDKYLGSISYPDYAATVYKSAPQTTIPKPVRPGSEPIPYKYPIYPSQTTIPQPAHPGWNPQPYKYPVYPSQTTIPQPARPGSNAPIASPWATAAQNNLMAQEDRYAGLGRNSPVVSEPIVKYMGLGNQPYNGYNQFDPIARRDFVAPNGSRTQPGTPQAGSMGGIVEDRFSRGNFVQVSREPFAAFNRWNEAYNGVYGNMQMAGPYRNAQDRANSYPFFNVAPFDQTVAAMGLRQWRSTLTPDYKDPWASDPFDPGGDPYMYPTLEAEYPTGDGGAGGWGYGGGYGGYGGYDSKHYNSNPNYIGGNRGYASAHRQNMLLWNI